MADRKGRNVSNLPVKIQDVPDTPTVSASNVGTSRAYNNGAATVTIAKGTGGQPASYSITTTPSTTTTAGVEGANTITGLSSATSYTVNVTATNAAATSAATTTSSFTATTVPQNPTIGTPTVATGQSYTGSANVSVPFTPGATGGAAISSYTVLSSSGNSNTGASSPISVSDTVGTARTYTVTATNANGTSTASSASAATTPSSVPQAPTIGTFTDGGTGTTGTLSFTANATGGSAITNYKVSTNNVTFTALSPAQTSSPLSLSGLSVGTATYYIKAVNANGDSAASSGVSGTVIQPTAFESIATVTGNGTATTYTFSSIPSTYKALQIRSNVIYSSTTGATLRIRLNGDTGSNYAVHDLGGGGITASAVGYASQSLAYLTSVQQNGIITYPNVAITDIIDYASTTKNKTIRSFYGADQNASGGEVGLTSGLWLSTAAVNSITIFTSPNFNTGTTIALYGVKG